MVPVPAPQVAEPAGFGTLGRAICSPVLQNCDLNASCFGCHASKIYLSGLISLCFPSRSETLALLRHGCLLFIWIISSSGNCSFANVDSTRISDVIDAGDTEAGGPVVVAEPGSDRVLNTNFRTVNLSDATSGRPRAFVDALHLELPIDPVQHQQDGQSFVWSTVRVRGNAADCVCNSCIFLIPKLG